MKDELNLLLDQLTDERISHRKREAFLISIILHLLFVLLVVIGPKIFPTSRSKDSTERELSNLERSKQLGYLALPKDYQKLFRRPKTPVPSDKDRVAQGKAPKIDPKGLRAPYSKGSTKFPEQSSPPRTAEPPTHPPRLPAQDSEQKGSPKEEVKQTTGADDATHPPEETGQGKANLRDLFAKLEAPGASIQSSLEKARNNGSYGSGSGSGDAIRNFDNRQPNFSVDQPTILTDTQGVDFGAWLRLIYFRVRDNWYSVIPELIRSGTKGKVVLIFDVRNDGRIENLQVVKTSGLSSYDRAALSSIKLSEPFPNFPPAFSGTRITLQFSYFYNIKL